ncbi:MAG: hypothetical protein IIU70_02140 [Anaerotignum sp.]|nr:hypothetical protein [Anaerotignum sp.]
MDWWSMQVLQVEKILHTDRQEGLSEGEAARRLTLDGKNRLEDGKGKKGFFRRFLEQFNSREFQKVNVLYQFKMFTEKHLTTSFQ